MIVWEKCLRFGKVWDKSIKVWESLGQAVFIDRRFVMVCDSFFLHVWSCWVGRAICLLCAGLVCDVRKHIIFMMGQFVAKSAVSQTSNRPAASLKCITTY